jgi:hemolysin activation/secretion protein
MNFYFLLACTSSVCLSWNYPLSANITTGKTDKGSIKPVESDLELINSTTDQEGSVELLSQKINNYRCYSNKTRTYRAFVAQRILSIPLGTLEPEPITPSPLPETLPSSKLSIPLIVPKRSPIPPQLAPIISPKVKVTRIEVNGSTVFSPEELARTVNLFIGQELSYEQLLEIRTAVNELYVSNGYVTSGSFLPSQDIDNGVIQVQVVEGSLERVDIRGLKRLRESYVRSRIRLVASPPLNIPQLREGLQLLQDNPLFSRVEAELTAATAPGKNVLILNLKEAQPIDSAVIIDNREVPSVGSLGATAAISHNNLLGFGDRLSAEAGITGGVNSYSASYVLPINPRNGTIGFRYSNGKNRVTEQPFAPLEITGRAQTYAIDFLQPIILTPREELALSLSAQLRQSRTFLFDNEPFSFTQGPENGESKVSVLRFSTDWVNRPNASSVVAARSIFSLGLGLFDATTNDTGIDGRFGSWLGQFQYVRAINSQRDAVVIGRVAAQLTPDSLLPLEQFYIGGVETVRGYRTSQRAGDNGATGSVELRLPIVRDPGGFGLVQVVPFIDMGTSWNNNNDQSATLLSTGLGLRWQLNNSFSASLDWGIPIISVDRQGKSLQDNGISFSIRVEPF